VELGTEYREGICVIIGKGDLDADGAAELKKLFMQRVRHQIDRFIILMKDVVSIDSDGVGALLFIASTARRLVLHYCFAAPPEPVMSVLEKIRIAGYFSFADSLEAALEQLAAEEPEELTGL
jgi:anti-sigma B factor antagonist